MFAAAHQISSARTDGTVNDRGGIANDRGGPANDVGGAVAAKNGTKAAGYDMADERQAMEAGFRKLNTMISETQQ